MYIHTYICVNTLSILLSPHAHIDIVIIIVTDVYMYLNNVFTKKHNRFSINLIQFLPQQYTLTLESEFFLLI